MDTVILNTIINLAAIAFGFEAGRWSHGLLKPGQRVKVNGCSGLFLERKYLVRWHDGKETLEEEWRLQ